MVTALSRTQPLSKGRWNTLQLLRWMGATVLLLDGLVLMLVTGTARQHRDTVHVLVEQAAPGSFAAHSLETALAAMDAEACHELLVPPGATVNSSAGYDAQRSAAVRGLIRTAETLQGDPGATAQVEALEVALGSYQRLLQQALDLHDHGDLSAAAQVYARAAEVLQARLLPGAEALSTERTQVVSTSSDSQQRHSTEARLTLLLLLVLEVCSFAVAQIVLSMRTHRTLSLPLLTATLTVAAAGAHFVSVLHIQQQQLSDAQQGFCANLDRLASIQLGAHLIVDEQMERLAGAGGSSINPVGAAAEEAKIATLPAGMSAEQVSNSLGSGRSLPGFVGLLPDLLQNATSARERDTVAGLLPAWAHFVAAHRAASRAEQSKDRPRALLLAAGPGADAAPRTMQALDEQLDVLTNRDKAAYEDLLRRNSSVDGRLQAEAWLVCLFVASLVTAGFAPRIREYL